MNLRPYPEYKDSGVDWIGEIPEDWDIFKLKHVVNEFVSGGTPNSDNENFWSQDDNEGIPWVAIGDMSNREFVNETNKKITVEGLVNKKLRLLKKGTILYSIFASLGKVSILNINATTNQAILGLILSKKIHDNYLKYYLKFLEEPIIALSNANTQNNLNSTIVKNISMSLPKNIAQQEQTASFLDKKTSKLDKTIEKDTKLIELLQEKRTALINHVVTKGLDPESPMKDSGIEWIGEIPEGWEVKRLKNFGKIVGGYAFKSTDFTEEGTKSIKITNIQSFSFNWDEIFYLPENFAKRYSDFLVKKGDVVFALTRPIISTGIKVAIFDETENALANQRTGIFKISSEDLNLPFLYYSVYSKPFINDFSSKITETNQPNISPNDIGEIKLILPPKEEQNQIVEYLDKKTSNIDKAINKIQKNIELLQEYKKSLIHHVVTGKVDVRDVV